MFCLHDIGVTLEGVVTSNVAGMLLRIHLATHDL